MVKPVKSARPAKAAVAKYADPESSGQKRLTVANGMMKEWTHSALAIMGSLYDYNPDDLVQAKGVGVRIYQDMLRDPYVKTALNLKKFSVARLPSNILPASESEEDQEVAKFVEWNLENMETSMDSLLWGIMDCVNIGYSIGEQNYRVIEQGDFKGKIGLKGVKSKDPYVFTFRINPFGDIEKVVQRIGGGYADMALGGPSTLSVYRTSEFPPEKFLIGSFQPLYANPYGQSDLRAAYRAFFIKDWAWKFRSIFMEKWGMPPIIGRFPNGTDEARRKKLEEVIDSIQNDTTITIPEDLQIEILKVAQEGRTTEYERAIADLNKEILIGIMGSFLAVEEGRKTGARAQGEVHFAVSKLFIEHLGGLVSDILNRQVIRRLVDMNYSVTAYPKHRFDTSRAEELLKEIEIDKTLVELGVKLDERYFYGKYGRPTPSESETVRAIGRDVPEIAEPEPDPALQADPLEGQGEALQQPPEAPVVDDSMKGEFSELRKMALPSDPKKIGDLRNTYEWLMKTAAVRGGARAFSGIPEAAFQAAGKERLFFSEHGRWLTADEAWQLFKRWGIVTKGGSRRG